MTGPPAVSLAPSPANLRAAGAMAAAQRTIIAENPLALTLRRTERLPAEGAWVITRRAHGPYTVRVYQEAANNPFTGAGDSLPAERRDQTLWSLLALADADLCGDPDAWDEADIPRLGLVRVTSVLPLTYAQTVFGYRARLELLRPVEGDPFPNPLLPAPNGFGAPSGLGSLN